MTTWNAADLDLISRNADLYVSPFRPDGITYGTPTQTWALVVDGQVYVRAANGPTSSWYQAAITQRGRPRPRRRPLLRGHLRPGPRRCRRRHRRRLRGQVPRQLRRRDHARRRPKSATVVIIPDGHCAVDPRRTRRDHSIGPDRRRGGPDQQWPERFPWLPILVLGFAWFLAVAIELSPAGLLNAIAADLDVSVVAVGTMTTFYALGNALLVLPLTALAIKFARRTALTVVMIVFVASNLIVALAPTIVVADIGRFIGGASYAVICTLFPAVVVRIAGPRHAAQSHHRGLRRHQPRNRDRRPRSGPGRQRPRLAHHLPRRRRLALVAGVLMSFFLPKTRGSAAQPLTLTQTARATRRAPRGHRLVAGHAGSLRRPHLHRGLLHRPGPRRPTSPASPCSSSASAASSAPSSSAASRTDQCSPPSSPDPAWSPPASPSSSSAAPSWSSS